jgi:hypothetical protein
MAVGNSKNDCQAISFLAPKTAIYTFAKDINSSQQFRRGFKKRDMSPDAMEDEVSPEAQRLGLDQKSHEINIFDDEFSHLRSFNDEFSW